MKKYMLMAICLCLLNSAIYSQENTPQRFAVTLDIFPAIEGAFEGNTGLGIFFESRISKHFSLVPEFNFYVNPDNDDINLTAIAHGRVYPFATTLGKAFYDLGIGYRRGKWEEADDIHALIVTLSAGWKFIVGRGFVIEPNIGFWNNIAELKGEAENTHAPIVGVNFGWAF